ncbi:MAG TPA: hypothetical protein VD735_00205, partial [Candidatus Saccharimonadales bacterium]|nr:hypothetical protein [Candidatus Saccharimonadales bacterium]
QWPVEQTPPANQREAYLMAEPLKSRLRAEGLDYAAINSLVKTQGDSNNSIGDVAVSMERGLLNIDDFHRPNNLYALDLIAGKLHGMHFGLILRAALDLAPGQVRRAPIHDVYSKPATPFRKAEGAPIGIAREMVAIGLTKVVLRDVQPGNVASLLEAEERFNKLAAKGAKKS